MHHSSENEEMRKNDVLVGEMIGTLKQFFERYEADQKQHKDNLEESREWRKVVEKRFEVIEDFVNDLRTPHKMIIFVMRAFMIAAIGGMITYLFNFFREHFKW